MTDPAAQLVPLDRLYIHPLNNRSEPPAADIAALADSIATIGLLQNLLGYADPEQPGLIGIVAGGRRLRALNLLRARDAILIAAAVQVTDDEATARLWASAENAARQDLSPADEIEAFRRMVDQGADISTISVAFAVTTRQVRQRLKLAALPPLALDALREGRLTLDQAAALTTAETQEEAAQLAQRVLSSTWTPGADEIRRMTAKTSVSGIDRRAVFVGLDAYREAGGPVQEDLFSDRIRLLDEKLLDRLFNKRLQAEAKVLRAEGGWKWVEITSESYVPRGKVAGLRIIERVPVDLPEADADEAERLSERDDLTPEDALRLEELEARAEGYYADEDIATSGVWLFVDLRGRLRQSDPYRRPADEPATGEEEADDDAGSGPTAPAAPESPALSISLRDDLARIRLAALQIRLAEQTELALDLLAWRLGGNLKPWAMPVAITPTPQNIEPEKMAGFSAVDWMADEPRHGDEDATAEGLAAFRALGKRHRNQVLARAIARCLVGSRAIAPSLAARLDPAPREIWTPTAEGYFRRLPGPALHAIWCELVPDDRTPSHAEFRERTKGDKADLLHRLFNEADFRSAMGLSAEQSARVAAWLPAELHWPAVEPEAQDEEAA